MIISYVHPYDLARMPIDVDTERDFYKFPVNTSGYVESNKFLVSLWNQFNLQICPKHNVDRVPWACFPGKFVGKSSSVSVLGFCQTTMGELYLALEYHKKGDIDFLLVMRPGAKLKCEEKQKIRTLVETAKTELDRTKCFLCKAKIFLKGQEMCFAAYYADNFCIIPCVGGGTIYFYVNAIDRFEAEQQTLERLYEICAFLTVEINISCSFEKFIVTENKKLPMGESSSTFVDDYIDYYPHDKNWQICISNFAYKFINNNILSIGRFEKRREIEKFFISACKHVQIGVESELKISTIGVASLPFSTISLTNIHQRNKVEYMTSALMSYLSAIECATAIEGNHEICKVCGAIIYKIAKRVRNLSSEFLGDFLGSVFHKLYAYRSKFLHTGRMASDSNVIRTIPLLSESSETGVKEFGNVAVKVNGKIYSFDIRNIREWTTYILRCYYQKRILGRTSFADVFNEKTELTIDDLPLTVRAISPQGSVFMKKIFVRTNTFKYKLCEFFKLSKIRLQKVYNKIKRHS